MAAPGRRFWLKIAAQAGAYMLTKPLGGSGVLLGGVPGVAPACVLVIGGGVVGLQAAQVASDYRKLGARNRAAAVHKAERLGLCRRSLARPT